MCSGAMMPIAVGEVAGKVAVPNELALEAGVGPVAAAGIGQYVDLGVVDAIGLEAGAGRAA